MSMDRIPVQYLPVDSGQVPGSGTGGYAEDTTVGSDTLSSVVSGIINPDTAGTDGNTKIIAVDEYGKVKSASYDEISGADKIIDLAPDALVKLPLKLLVNATNDTAASVTRTIINFKGYDNATISVICAGGMTVNIYGTNNDAADASTDTGWVSLSASSIVDTTDGWVINGQAPWDRLMIRRAASTSSNSTVVDVTLGG